MGRRRNIAIGAAVAVGLGLAAARMTSPPRLLSLFDAAVGGGEGVEQVGSAIAFGPHGQTLDLWRPTKRPDRPLPVLIFWYGGGWTNGSRTDYAFAARAFAGRGFIVVVPDVRKVPEVRFPAFLVDGAQAVRWTRDNVGRFGGDPDRIAVSGHSSGAYTAVMLTLDERWLAAENLSATTIKAAVGLCGPYDFYPFDDKRSIAAMQGAADPLLTQPIHFVRADAAPLLLISAGDDTQVHAHNANNLTARLKALDGRVDHIDYPGLSHEGIAMALSRPFRGKAPVLTDSIAFLKRTMESRPPAATDGPRL